MTDYPIWVRPAAKHAGISAKKLYEGLRQKRPRYKLGTLRPNMLQGPTPEDEVFEFLNDRDQPNRDVCVEVSRSDQLRAGIVRELEELINSPPTPRYRLGNLVNMLNLLETDRPTAAPAEKPTTSAELLNTQLQERLLVLLEQAADKAVAKDPGAAREAWQYVAQAKAFAGESPK